METLAKVALKKYSHSLNSFYWLSFVNRHGTKHAKQAVCTHGCIRYVFSRVTFTEGINRQKFDLVPKISSDPLKLSLKSQTAPKTQG